MSTSVNSKKISPTSLGIGSAWRVIQCPNSRCITKSTKRQWKLLVGRVKWDACATLLIEVLMHDQWDLSAFELHRGAFYLLLLLATCGISQQSNGSPNNTRAQTRHIWYSCSNLNLIQTCYIPWATPLHTLSLDPPPQSKPHAHAGM